MSVERITKTQALRAVRAKLPILGTKKLQEVLDFAIGCCSRCSEGRALAEAYLAGASAAQIVIAARVAAVGIPRVAPAATKTEETP